VAYLPAIESTPEDNVLRQDAGSQDVLFTETRRESSFTLSPLPQTFFSKYRRGKDLKNFKHQETIDIRKLNQCCSVLF
jgi:hypothetical protein